MARKQLAKLKAVGGKHTFTAIVTKHRGPASEPWTMLKQVRRADTGKQVADHLWVRSHTVFALPYRAGIRFRASIRRYTRWAGEPDYTLYHFRDVTVVTEGCAEHQRFPPREDCIRSETGVQ
jgi:hypothetical protein